MANIIGIYKLEAPNGAIYIGQSWNCARRWQGYKEGRARGSPKLDHALKKYGFRAFSVELLVSCETQEQLNAYERFWISVYGSTGRAGLNCMAGGSGHGCHSEESKAKMSASLIGRTICQEQREEHSRKMKGVPKSAEHRAAIAAAKTGLTLPVEVRAKISAANKGKKRTPEQAAKCATWTGRRHSEETKQKMSASMRGLKRSPEARANIATAARNRRKKEPNV